MLNGNLLLPRGRAKVYRMSSLRKISTDRMWIAECDHMFYEEEEVRSKDIDDQDKDDVDIKQLNWTQIYKLGYCTLSSQSHVICCKPIADCKYNYMYILLLELFKQLKLCSEST